MSNLDCHIDSREILGYFRTLSEHLNYTVVTSNWVSSSNWLTRLIRLWQTLAGRTLLETSLFSSEMEAAPQLPAGNRLFEEW